MAIVPIVLSVFAIVVSVVSLLLAINRDIGAVRPVLVFTYRQEGWHIENVGSGPALDLVFHRLRGEVLTQSVRLPALGQAAAFCLHFARHDSKQIFAATYRDRDSRPYTSTSQHDISTWKNGFTVERAPDPESLDRWWELPDSDA